MERPSRTPDLAFNVTGMMCQQNCATTVQRAISTVKGVEFVEVSFPNEEALVWGKSIVVQEVIDEVGDMGYDATIKQDITSDTDPAEMEIPPDITLAIKGMFDSDRCPRKVHELVSHIDGVSNVKVEFSKKLCLVWGFAEVPAVIEALAKEGYGARDASDSASKSGAANVPPPKQIHHSQQKMQFNLDKLLRIGNLSSIESKLKSIQHVISVQTDVEGRTVAVYCAQGADVTEAVMESVKRLKYSDALIVTTGMVAPGGGSGKAGRKEFVFDVTGMSCAACAARVEKAITSLTATHHPATEVAVSAMTNKARVVIHDAAAQLGPRTISEKVGSIGYGCTLKSIDNVNVMSGDTTTADAAQADELSEWYLPLLVSLALGIPVMTLHLTMTSSEDVMMMLDMPLACHGGVNYMQGTMFALNLPILLIVGYRYYKGAVVGAMHGSFGMDCLVTTGTSITFLYSCVQLAMACTSHTPTKHTFFETTGMLLMFVTVGKYIEAYAKRRSFAAISNLLKLQPREVCAYFCLCSYLRAMAVFLTLPLQLGTFYHEQPLPFWAA
jgi:cation transport ATPase